MTATDEIIRQALAAALPALELSLGKIHGAPDATKRYGVLRPAGGGRGDVVRRPQFVLDIMGRKGGDFESTRDLMEEAILVTRSRIPGLIGLNAGEPSHTTSAEGRPVFSVALSAIVETS